MTESTTQSQIMLSLSRGETRLFRANAGKAWQGKATFDARRKTLTLKNYHAIQLMPEGTPDLIGWHQHTISAADVGKTFAVFVGIEVKSRSGRYREKQRKFRDAIIDSGGLSGIARTVQQAREILEEIE